MKAVAQVCRGRIISQCSLGDHEQSTQTSRHHPRRWPHAEAAQVHTPLDVVCAFSSEISAVLSKVCEMQTHARTIHLHRSGTSRNRQPRVKLHLSQLACFIGSYKHPACSFPQCCAARDWEQLGNVAAENFPGSDA